MKIKTPRSYLTLPPKERDKISEWIVELAKEQLEKDSRVMLDLYIKMVCVVLHDAFGFGEKRLTMFLGNHKRLFYRQHKKCLDGSQVEYLNQRMKEIFKKGGFPQEFFDNMLGEVVTAEEE
ncbi:MAG: hypothetical protein J6V42_06070 [Clostridia bacterium]|nr:hypothetical protein [Clostridia bacterium]